MSAVGCWVAMSNECCCVDAMVGPWTTVSGGKYHLLIEQSVNHTIRFGPHLDAHMRCVAGRTRAHTHVQLLIGCRANTPLKRASSLSLTSYVPRASTGALNRQHTHTHDNELRTIRMVSNTKLSAPTRPPIFGCYLWVGRARMISARAIADTEHTHTHTHSHCCHTLTTTHTRSVRRLSCVRNCERPNKLGKSQRDAR